MSTGEDNRLAFRTLFWGGLLIASIGLSVLIGWLTGLKWLIAAGRSSWQVAPTAAGTFLIVGTALTAAALKWRGVVYVACAAIVAPRLLQLAGFHLLPDPPHRMVAVLNLILVALLAALVWPGRIRFRAAAVGFLGLVMLAAALTGLSLHVFPVPSPTGAPIFPPLQSLAVTVIFGGGCVLWAWSHHAQSRGWLASGLPLVAGLAVVLGTIAEWHQLSWNERRQVQRMEELAASAVRGSVFQQMRERTRELRRLGRVWTNLAAHDRSGEVARILRIQREYRSIGWMDRAYCHIWSIPARRDRACADASLRRALEAGGAVSTQPGELPDGGYGFSIYVPVVRDGVLWGFAIGNLKLPEAMDEFLAVVDRNYSVRVSTGGREFYNRFGDSSNAPARRVLEVAHMQWEVEVWRHGELAAGERPAVPEVALAGGWALAALVSLSLRQVITDRQRAAILRQSELRYTLAARATKDAIWDWDIVAGTVTWNEGLRSLFGYIQGPVTSLEWWEERIHPEDRGAILAGVGAALDGGRESWQGEYRFRRADGAYASVVDRGHVVRGGAGKPVRMIGAMTDVTHHRELEEQLRQAQKMEAVGRLAGGVAHDFNNLLTVILGYSAVVREELDPSHPSAPAMVEIEGAAQRAAALTGQLLAFGRRQTLEPKVLNLNTVVGEIEVLLRRLIGEHIELRTEPSPDLALVRADPGQIGQVLMNLAINARDAMPSGGTLRIQTANAKDGVTVTVRDTGCGIDAATRARLFEPFFTTKELGKGTGLGLSTVYGIVKQSGGTITVQSEPGHGSAFEVWLPGLPVPATAL